MEDSVLFTFMKEQAESTARIEQSMTDMNRRLFGNGQPGILQYLGNKDRELDAKIDAKDTEICKRVDGVESLARKASEKSGRVLWLTGIFSAGGATLIVGAVQWLLAKFGLFHTVTH